MTVAESKEIPRIINGYAICSESRNNSGDSHLPTSSNHLLPHNFYTPVNIVKPSKSNWFLWAAAIALLMLPRSSAMAQDVVLDWNDLFSQVAAANTVNQNPGYASRSIAMMNLAIYDGIASSASSSVGSTFYNYATDYQGTTSDNTAEVAATHAAYKVLSSLYSDQQSTIDAFYNSSIANYSNTSQGIAIGTQISDSIIAARANDGSANMVNYQYNPLGTIGAFQSDSNAPVMPPWGTGWGQVDTFAISSAQNFLPAALPAVTSAQYAASYNEVKSLGAVNSTTRTADQTETGIFWAYDRAGLGTPMNLYNDVLENVAIQQGNTLKQNASLFAKASVAMADAGIVAWNSKFDEEFWRPGTAIEQGDFDGNPLTIGDSGWVALGAPDGGNDQVGFTPPFPTYISGHATFGGALFGLLEDFYGTDNIGFNLTSQELLAVMNDPALEASYGLNLTDATRSFNSFSEAMIENGRSRVYLGIHFDFDDLVAQEVGQNVASAVSGNSFVSATAVPEPSTAVLLISGVCLLMVQRRRR